MRIVSSELEVDELGGFITPREEDEGGDGPEEAPVPLAVEDVGRDQQQEVLRPQMAVRHEPIQPEDNRQEDQKLRAVEEH